MLSSVLIGAPGGSGSGEWGSSEFGDAVFGGGSGGGGVEFLTKTLIANFSISDSIGDRIGIAKFSIYGSPAAIGASILPNATVELYDGTAGGGSSSGEWGDSEFGDAVFGGGGEENDAVRIFYGRIITIIPVAHILGASGTGWTQYDITARTFADLLDGAVVETAITYTGQTDQFIINDLFANYLPDIGTSGVDNTTTISSITFDQQTLRQALKSITDLTGAQAWVDPNKILQYHSPAAIAAPFGISDEPDGISTFAPLEKPTYRWDMPIAANWVKVIGALESGGTPITSIREDAASQGVYGIIKKVIPDRGITTTAEAEARGDVELERYANPTQSGTFATLEGGLSIGQLINISLPGQAISGDFVLSRVTMTYLDTGQAARAKWVVEFGPYQPDLFRAIRRSLTETVQPPQTPYAIPPPFSIVPGSFASTIQPVHIVNSLPVLPDASYPNDTVVILTSDSKLYRNASGTWTAAVPTVDLTGQITVTQITDGAVTTPKIAALAVESGNIAANAITSGKIIANAIVAGKIAAGALVAGDGVISNLYVTTAMIQAAQITQAKIADLAVGTAQIDELAVTTAKIQDVAISTAKIDNLAVTDAKINSLSASKITAGTIDASVINVINLNASEILTGFLSADFITAGTMDVGSGGLTINGTGSGSFLIVTGGALFETLRANVSVFVPNGGSIIFGTSTLTSTTGALDCSEIKIGGTQIVDSGRISNFASMKIGGTSVVDSSRNAAFVDCNVSGVYKVAGNTVVGPRLSDIGAPSFAVLADAQAYCALLRTALRDHGLMA